MNWNRTIFCINTCRADCSLTIALWQNTISLSTVQEPKMNRKWTFFSKTNELLWKFKISLGIPPALHESLKWTGNGPIFQKSVHQGVAWGQRVIFCLTEKVTLLTYAYCWPKTFNTVWGDKNITLNIDHMLCYLYWVSNIPRCAELAIGELTPYHATPS